MKTSVEMRESVAKPGKLASFRQKLVTKKDQLTNQGLYLIAMLMVSTPVMAEEFSTFREKIEDLAGGDFAIGISILALIMGCLFGLAKQSVGPAFLGLGIAGAFALGPYLIIQIFEWFA
ncbi:MAG: hypothetical protein ACRC3F_07445 [Billgrantia desiderata]